MRLQGKILCAVLCACVASAVAAVVWLEKTVREAREMRDAEIRVARVVALIQEWEPAIFRDWRKLVRKLDALPPEQFSSDTVREIASQTRFDFSVPMLANAPPRELPSTQLDEKFSVFQNTEGYFLLRRCGNGTQGLFYPETALFSTLEKSVTQAISKTENAELKIRRVPAESGFGIIRGLPGAKISVEVFPVERTESTAMRYATIFAVAGILAMLLVVFALALRVFTLSEKRFLFAAAVSHELKTSLAELSVCVATAQTLRSESDIRKKISQIRKSTQELCAIVDNLLIFFRLKTGIRHTQQNVVSTDALFTRIFERIAERLTSADMDANFDIEPKARERKIRASAEIIGQILFNLADNAAKYAYRENGENIVSFRVFVQHRALVVEVSDEGPGIPPAWQTRIFQPFARVSPKARNGLGLGISISAAAAKHLGGRLFLKKSNSAGTTFRLEIPLLEK